MAPDHVVYHCDPFDRSVEADWARGPSSPKWEMTQRERHAFDECLRLKVVELERTQGRGKVQ